MVIDLASSEGQRQLAGLARTAHALVTNLRPAAIRKLGLTYAALREVNPKLVCVALTGFGLDSPYADRPAYDYVIQAMTGVMEMTGEPDGPPTKAGYSAVELGRHHGRARPLGEDHRGQGRTGRRCHVRRRRYRPQLNDVASASLMPERRHGGCGWRIPTSSRPRYSPRATAGSPCSSVTTISGGGSAKRSGERNGSPTSASPPWPRAAPIVRWSWNSVGKVIAERTAAELVAGWCRSGSSPLPSPASRRALAGQQARARRMIVEIALGDGTIRTGPATA